MSVPWEDADRLCCGFGEAAGASGRITRGCGAGSAHQGHVGTVPCPCRGHRHSSGSMAGPATGPATGPAAPQAWQVTTGSTELLSSFPPAQGSVRSKNNSGKQSQSRVWSASVTQGLVPPFRHGSSCLSSHLWHLGLLPSPCSLKVTNSLTNSHKFCFSPTKSGVLQQRPGGMLLTQVLSSVLFLLRIPWHFLQSETLNKELSQPISK